jgi:lysozyme family protein
VKTLAAIVEDIFLREGDRYAEPPETDQPTGRGGLTLGTVQRYFDLHRPGWAATVEDLKALSHEEARAIVEWLLLELESDMGLRWVSYDPLRLHLVDFAYNSGGALAMRWLQRVLDVPRSGVMDGPTRDHLAVGSLEQRLIHHALLYARLEMVDRWTDAPVNKRFEEGLENRIHSFSLLEIP